MREPVTTETTIPRKERRRVLCQRYGVANTGRQWVRLRKRLRRMGVTL